MNIALINGSPKKGKSASKELLHELKTFFPSEAVCKEFTFKTPTLNNATIEELSDFDAMVFAFPLYVDGIPSHLLACLCKIEEAGIANKNIRVYCIVNSGFYEGKQSAIAIEILENWCNKVGLVWGMGIGFGGGGALSHMKSFSIGKGPKASLGAAYKDFSTKIIEKSSAKNTYISIGLPRFFYRIAAERSWRNRLTANGGKKEDLARRL